MDRTRTIYLLLVVATATVYAQVVFFDFVSYDDPIYVTKNEHVQHILDSIGDEASWCAPLYAFTICVYERDVGLVERGKVPILEGRSFAPHGIPRL